jgi:serine/threonine-protein kinase
VTDRQHPGGEPPGDLSPELRPLLARYEIFGELGRGGMAVVYHGRERRTDGLPAREVAIKVVSHRYTGDADAARRFAREAQTVAGLEHPNIVRTLAIEALGDDAAAIVSRYVPGETLRAALRAAGGPVDYGAP